MGGVAVGGDAVGVGVAGVAVGVGVAGVAVGEAEGDWAPTPATIMQVNVRRRRVFRFILRERERERDGGREI